MDKVIITVAVTGSQPTRQMNPNLPVTPEEIANSAYECFNEGASIVHVHVRDPKTGVRSMALELYAEVVERVRAKSNMIINLSTGSGGQLVIGPDSKPKMDFSIMEPPEKRVEHILKLKPEMCSLDIGSSNAGSSNMGAWVFVNAEPVVEKMAELIKIAGVKPEIEVFEIGHIQMANRLVNLGLIEKSAHFQLCMGSRGTIPATPKNVVYMAESLLPGSTWSIFGVGPGQFPMVAMGVLLGGHVRVGFEDNLYMRKGVLAKSNAELVRRAVQIIRDLNKDVASEEEARKILSLAASP